MHVTNLVAWRHARIERSIRALDILGLAICVYGHKRFAMAWMTAPHLVLGTPPCESIFNEAGAARVEALLVEKLADNQRVTEAVRDALDDRADAWMRAPNRDLGGYSPVDVLRGPAGPEVVLDALDCLLRGPCPASP